MTENLDINYFYRKILENDFGFNLLEKTFFEKNLTITHLANENHTSESTIYRTINHLNQVLKSRYSIELSTNPLVMLGNEIDIRRFYSQYFISRYDHFSWIYDDEIEKVFDTFLLSILKVVDYPIDYGFYKSIKTSVSVNLFRYKKGHVYRESMSTKKEPIIDIFNRVPKEVVNRFEETFLVGTRLSDLKQIFGAWIHPAVLYHPDQVDHLLQDTNHNQDLEERKVLSHLNALVDNLAERYQIKIQNKSKLLLHLNNAYYLRNTETYVAYLFADRKKQFLDSFTNQFTDFAQDAVQLMSDFVRDYCGQVTHESEYVHHLVYNLIINWANLVSQLEKLKPPVNLLIISDLDINHARSIQELIRHHFSTMVNTTLYKDINLDWKAIERADYDLVITTFPAKSLTNLPLLNISDYPDISVLNQLHMLISDIRNKKSANTNFKTF